LTVSSAWYIVRPDSRWTKICAFGLSQQFAESSFIQLTFQFQTLEGHVRNTVAVGWPSSLLLAAILNYQPI